MDALEKIAERIDEAENDKSEITDDELEVLNLTKPRARGKRNTIPVEYSLYRAEGAWLAVKKTSKNAGEKRIRHYATGVGDLRIEGDSLDADKLSDELPDEPQENIEAAVDWYRIVVEETFDFLLDEEVGALIDGNRLYGWCSDYGSMIEDATDQLDADGKEASRAVREARNLSKPSDIDYYVVEFNGTVELDHTPLLGDG